jgi:hypothetical protein
MRALFLALLVLSSPTVAAAQPPDDRRPIPPPPSADDTPTLSIRPFVMGAEQAFAAANTFDAAFGESRAPFFGGGVQVVIKGGAFVEAGASRFKKTGVRAFRNNGQNFSLGLPLTAEIRPFEITGGYRFHFASLRRVVPYGAAGFGSYGYNETSPSSDAGENVDTRHSGFVVNGGAEFRLHRWIGLAVDVQYTHIPGILGTGGISKLANETDLGGVAGRVKFVVGR